MLRLLATLSPILVLSLGALVGGLPAAGAAYYAGRLVGHHRGYSEGTTAMAAAVTKQNKAAGEAAGRAKANVDACYDAGGSWDQENGRCVE